jgi:hypothetical protein
MKFTALLATIASVSAYDWANYNSTLAQIYNNVWDSNSTCSNVTAQIDNWNQYQSQEADILQS